jgi:hypothetical protein
MVAAALLCGGVFENPDMDLDVSPSELARMLMQLGCRARETMNANNDDEDDNSSSTCSSVVSSPHTTLSSIFITLPHNNTATASTAFKSRLPSIDTSALTDDEAISSAQVRPFASASARNALFDSAFATAAANRYVSSTAAPVSAMVQPTTRSSNELHSFSKI